MVNPLECAGEKGEQHVAPSIQHLWNALVLMEDLASNIPFISGAVSLSVCIERVTNRTVHAEILPVDDLIDQDTV